MNINIITDTIGGAILYVKFVPINIKKQVDTSAKLVILSQC